MGAGSCKCGEARAWARRRAVPGTAAVHGVIRLRGVRQNNLKDIDLDVPRNALVVVTGPSGSGKSSLAFDTLYAEGQRRYVETFSPYARQFLDRMDRPQADAIEGIPPAIAIQQRNTVRTTRSTVGTMTEICDYMKVLWPVLARLYCPGCGALVRKHTPDSVWEWAVANCGAGANRSGPEVLVTFSVPVSARLGLGDSLALIQKQGYQRVLVQGRVVRVSEAELVLGPAPGTITVVQDRVRVVPEARARFVEACEQAFGFGKGSLALYVRDGERENTEIGAEGWRLLEVFNTGLHCARCGVSFREPTPGMFSFNHPLGACPKCNGFGRVIEIDYTRAIPDWSLSLAEGAIRPWRSGFSAECQRDLLKFCRARGVPVDVPFRDLTPEQRRWVIEGDPDYGIDEAHEWPYAWYGVKGYFKWLESRAYKMHVRVLLSRYRAYVKCPECNGTRFNSHALAYKLDLRELGVDLPCGAQLVTLGDFYALPVRDAFRVMEAVRVGLAERLQLRRNSQLALALDAVYWRLRYLVEIGLGYLTLDRPTRTLSGGETARVNLTACLGSRLVNTLFVLDEPSIGLHPVDTARLVRILHLLRDLGNTVVVVEHDPDVIRAADHVIDLGPGRGEAGGRVVFQGPYQELIRARESLTGRYLAGLESIPIPVRRPVPSWLIHPGPAADSQAAGGSGSASFPVLRIVGATKHNLKGLTVAIPLNRFVCVTGVSGSGKSTLVRDVLYRLLSRALNGAGAESGLAAEDVEDEQDPFEVPGEEPPAQVEGYQALGGVIMVDQALVMRTPRSNPALFVGAFEHIRRLYGEHPDARARGLSAAAFSFNSAVGQCERCRGAGFEKIEMQFLSDVFVRCPACNGRRYKPAVLDVRIAPPGVRSGRNARSIADLLEMTVSAALEFLHGFGDNPHALRAVQALQVVESVGLGYLQLGQPINMLSGGECQRLKLARVLAAAPVGQARRPLLFLFDEPTTGLHMDDIRTLLPVLQGLVDAGHSVIVVEHNLEVIKCADWVIDLGPGAGDEGGQLVAAGPPEHIAACSLSRTGQVLQTVLQKTN